MRSIILLDPDTPTFEVADDPQHVIAQFLSAALNDPDYSQEEIAELLRADGDGYYVIDHFNLFIAQYPEDLPADQTSIWADQLDTTDVWLIGSEKRHAASNIAIMNGDELRQIFARACQLLHEAESNTINS